MKSSNSTLPSSRGPDERVKGSTTAGLTGDAGGVTAAEIAAIGLRYVGAVIMTRILGLTWFGSVTLGITIASLLGMASVLGLSPGMLPFLARARRDGRVEGVRAVIRASWSVVVVASAGTALLVFVTAPTLAHRVFEDPQMVGVLRVLSLVIAFSAMTTVSTTILQGLLGVRAQAVIDRILPTFVSVGGFTLTWIFGWGVPGVLGSLVAGPLVALVVAVVCVTRLAPGVLPGAGKADPLPIRDLMRESWPLMGVSMFAFVLMWMDVLLMGVFRSPDEVALYAACARLAPAVVLVHNTVGPVFLARLNVSFLAGDWPSIRHLYRRTGMWSLWSGAVVASVFLVFGRELLALFGPGFVAGFPVLVLLTLGRTASASAGMCGRMLTITGRARLNLANMLMLIVVNGALDLVWIPSYGAMGAATATCISVTLVNLVQTVEVWKIYRVHPFTSRSALVFLGTAALAGMTHLGRRGVGGEFGWLVSLGVFLLASVVLYGVIGATEDERALLWKRLRR